MLRAVLDANVYASALVSPEGYPGLLLLPASFLFGWLWQGISAEAAFGFSASCAVLAALLLKFWVAPTVPANSVS